jgi:hypothetical protein
MMSAYHRKMLLLFVIYEYFFICLGGLWIEALKGGIPT